MEHRRITHECLAALGAIVLLTLTGCAAPGPVLSPPVTVGATVATTPPPDAAGILFQVDPAPSRLVLTIAAFAAPTVTVFRDGTVYLLAEPGEEGSESRPPVIMTGRADPARLAAFVDELESWQPPSDDADFGFPQVTDLSPTRVRVNTVSRATVVDVYGLSSSFDDLVDGSERSRRVALRRLADLASALPGTGEPYLPSAVRAVDLGPAKAEPGAPDWTGPAVGSFAPQSFPGRGCARVDGSAGDLYVAARANASAVWNTPSGPRTIAVTPLVPGQPACP